MPHKSWSLLRNAQWFEYSMHSSIFPSDLVYSLFCMCWQCFPLVITVFCVIVSFSPHSLRVWESFSLCTSASFVPLWAGGSDNIVKESCIELRNMTHVLSRSGTFSPVSRTETWHGAAVRPYLLRALRWPWALLIVIVLCFLIKHFFSRRLVSSSLWIDLFLLCVLWLTFLYGTSVIMKWLLLFPISCLLYVMDIVLEIRSNFRKFSGKLLVARPVLLNGCIESLDWCSCFSAWAAIRVFLHQAVIWESLDHVSFIHVRPLALQSPII